MRTTGLLVATLGTCQALTAYQRLTGATVLSVADRRPVELTSTWQGNQKVVVEFLRHFGWVFCWERAVQLRRDALPALEKAGVGLAVVGIGSLDAGETFASRTEFPKSMLYVDDSDESETYRAAGTRNTKRKPDGKADFEGIGSMWSQSTNDALKKRGKKDLDAITGSLFKPGIYTPLMPKGSTMTRSMEKTMVQGGSFVFEGDATLFEHYDESSGAHAGIDEILKAAGAA